MLTLYEYVGRAPSSSSLRSGAVFVSLLFVQFYLIKFILVRPHSLIYFFPLLNTQTCEFVNLKISWNCRGAKLLFFIDTLVLIFIVSDHILQNSLRICNNYRCIFRSTSIMLSSRNVDLNCSNGWFDMHRNVRNWLREDMIGWALTQHARVRSVDLHRWLGPFSYQSEHALCYFHIIYLKYFHFQIGII